MRKLFLVLFFLLLPNVVSAACDDPLTDGVDYTNCRFSDGQDLQGSYLPNSNLTFASFIQVNYNTIFLVRLAFLLCFFPNNCSIMST